MTIRTAPRADRFAIVAAITAGCTSFAGLHLPNAESSDPVSDASVDAPRSDLPESGSAPDSGDARTTGYRDVVLADAPVAYWRFGEASGTSAVDEVGGHDGVYGGTTLGVRGALAGDPNTAASFESGAMELAEASALAFDDAKPFSMEAWIYPQFLDTSWRTIMERLVYSSDSTREGYQLTINSTTTLCELWRGPDARSVSTGAMPINTYTHIVCSYDGANLRLFVNGTQVGAQPAVIDLELTTQSFSVGTKYQSNVYFPGAIDEVAVYAKDLKSSRVAAHHAAGMAQN